MDLAIITTSGFQCFAYQYSYEAYPSCKLLSAVYLKLTVVFVEPRMPIGSCILLKILSACKPEPFCDYVALEFLRFNFYRPMFVYEILNVQRKRGVRMIRDIVNDYQSFLNQRATRFSVLSYINIQKSTTNNVNIEMCQLSSYYFFGSH